MKTRYYVLFILYFFSISEWYATLQQIRIFGKTSLTVCREPMFRIWIGSSFVSEIYWVLWVRIQEVKSREAREGWPLLTVETEVNGVSEITKWMGLVGSLGLSCQYNRFLACLGCSRRPSTKYFFPRRTLFQFLCPQRPASCALCRQLCWVACLLIYVSD